MANFTSGVASYIRGTAQVDVFFPVDERGSADVSCNQCKYFRRNYRMCGLNSEVCNYPERNIGVFCPLMFEEEKTEREEEKG